MSRPLYVTRPLLPDLASVQSMLAEIWKTGILTNGGPMHEKLEREMEAYLSVPNAMLFNNGTIALLVALKMMDLPPGSEVITTPLTFAATAHAIAWNGLVPVFADVDPDTLTIDPASIEKAVTRKTSAILAVHVYGTICDVIGIQAVADRYDLRVIYDAAHVFGATMHGRSIGSFGDASVFSFHATKLFNTLEGGLITTPRQEDRQVIYNLRNFGIKSEEEVVSIGINGKMNEVQAAIGLLNIPLVEEERRRRSILREKYFSIFRSIPGITLPIKQKGVINSEQYFHIVIDPAAFGKSRDEIYDNLKKRGIFARKYFHPICTDFEPYKDFPIFSSLERPWAEIVKSQVLCLPFHSGVEDEDILDIAEEFGLSVAEVAQH
ncbi:DegT/DnrJ/EryC1/StrS family aminotransferase [Sphingobium sp. EP60837]|uniref:DegT/DnrJ/EryC1/StrS family aminotransferase n=1 Tax=Sphingobium sp. EP60837 TaxID=1855519 RepID=UPI0007DD4598|nr:DegT/DnrJ/EryC1/StrS family aminotransferase [Sphingobium sp. EP60837]ANI78466.1 dTDP-4-amino-4,6-dideoxy-D-glucose transaminase [Sphingobium sp. EP60837]